MHSTGLQRKYHVLTRITQMIIFKWRAQKELILNVRCVLAWATLFPGVLKVLALKKTKNSIDCNFVCSPNIAQVAAYRGSVMHKYTWNIQWWSYHDTVWEPDLCTVVFLGYFKKWHGTCPQELHVHCTVWYACMHILSCIRVTLGCRSILVCVTFIMFN